MKRIAKMSYKTGLTFIGKGMSYSTLFHIVFISVMLLSTTDSSAQSTLSEKLASLNINIADLHDWSDSTDIILPEPTCAYINITGTTKMPAAKNRPYNAWMEVYDNNGNYFKKRVIMDGQGNSSKNFVKRNFKVDFCEDEWQGNKTTDITFGNWVSQDGFHFKAFWYDRFRGIGIVAYKLYDDMVASRGGYKGRAWSLSGVENDKFDVRALCHPDGFPVAVYLNGNFYGIYTWQLKKHRKNMNLIKDVPEMIHIDGETNRNYLFGGTISWKHLELRNPKTMYTMDGKEYDKDLRGELIDETSEFYDLPDDTEKVKKHKRNSAITKKYIQQLANYYNEMYDLYKSKATAAKMREEMEKRFDVGNLIDYYLFSYLTDNYDGQFTNWQWATWDGVRWFVNPYDLDCTFGLENYGHFIYPHTVCSYRGNIGMGSHPFLWVSTYYKDEVFARYAELRDNKVFNTNHFISMLQEWMDRIGDDLYDDEWKRWPTSPCISEDILNPNWEWVPNWSSWTKTPAYDEKTTYHEGDIVTWWYRKWKATGTTTGVPPCSQQGYTDSIERVRYWLDGRLASMDIMMHYTPKPFTLGDVNDDGEVGLADILLLVDYILGSPADGINKAAGDADEDGDISLSDIMIIIDIILK